MKTNQLLTRHIGQFEVMQRTVDGMFDANVLLNQWNSDEQNPRRKMVEFLNSPKTLETVNAIINEISPSRESDYGNNEIVKTIKGRNTKQGKTPDQVWMHPYLFIDFAMWLNPVFKVKVLKFVYDELIRYRVEAGNCYIPMCASIKRIVPRESLKDSITQIAKALNIIVYNKHEKMLRNHEADEQSLKELYNLERDITYLIDNEFVRNMREVMAHLRKLYRKKYNLTPNALQS
jgi:hypothetical protein